MVCFVFGAALVYTVCKKYPHICGIAADGLLSNVHNVAQSEKPDAQNFNNCDNLEAEMVIQQQGELTHSIAQQVV